MSKNLKSKNTKHVYCKYLRPDFDWSHIQVSGGRKLLGDDELEDYYDNISKWGNRDGLQQKDN